MAWCFSRPNGARLRRPAGPGAEHLTTAECRAVAAVILAYRKVSAMEEVNDCRQWISGTGHGLIRRTCGVRVGDAVAPGVPW